MCEDSECGRVQMSLRVNERVCEGSGSERGFEGVHMNVRGSTRV